MPSGFRLSRLRGFTLVELLVVIAIIGVLVAILLPAVQAAREAARRMQCQNNLKQLALALHNYHDIRKTFPPGVQFPYREPSIYISEKCRANWAILILPFIEEQNSYNQFDLKVPISDSKNRIARGLPISTFRCPTDIGHDVLYAGLTTGTPNYGDNWGRGNYGANAGGVGMGWHVFPNMVAHCGSSGVGPNHAPGWLNPVCRGVMGACASVSLNKITDGASHTLLVGELRVGLNERDHRGSWALGQAGASALFWSGAAGDAHGPNACNDGSDSTLSCGYLKNTEPGFAVLERECMMCDGSSYAQGTSRSRHVGGVYGAYCDGSVHFINDLIYSSTVFDPPGPWDYLITCCDGGYIPPE
jgi:prepilin-type N-terminal cleavage/methylation domain-containing protein